MVPYKISVKICHSCNHANLDRPVTVIGLLERATQIYITLFAQSWRLSQGRRFECESEYLLPERIQHVHGKIRY